jgi:hypothetical protein
VLRDIPAEIGEVMRIGVMAVKAEREDRQPNIARVAGAVDDSGAGQHQRNEAEVIEVGRHAAAVTTDGHGGSLLSLGSHGSIDFVGVPTAKLTANNFHIA